MPDVIAERLAEAVCLAYELHADPRDNAAPDRYVLTAALRDLLDRGVIEAAAGYEREADPAPCCSTAEHGRVPAKRMVGLWDMGWEAFPYCAECADQLLHDGEKDFGPVPGYEREATG